MVSMIIYSNIQCLFDEKYKVSAKALKAVTQLKFLGDRCVMCCFNETDYPYCTRQIRGQMDNVHRMFAEKSLDISLCWLQYVSVSFNYTAWQHTHNTLCSSVVNWFRLDLLGIQARVRISPEWHTRVFSLIVCIKIKPKNMKNLPINMIFFLYHHCLTLTVLST